MKGRSLTVAALVAKGACHEQVLRFRLRFGASVEVTEAVCVEHSDKFDYAWAANNLLSAPARKEYDKVCEAAREEHGKVWVAAGKEYDKVCAAAFARAYIGDMKLTPVKALQWLFLLSLFAFIGALLAY